MQRCCLNTKWQMPWRKSQSKVSLPVLSEGGTGFLLYRCAHFIMMCFRLGKCMVI